MPYADDHFEILGVILVLTLVLNPPPPPPTHWGLTLIISDPSSGFDSACESILIFCLQIVTTELCEEISKIYEFFYFWIAVALENHHVRLLQFPFFFFFILILPTLIRVLTDWADRNLRDCRLRRARHFDLSQRRLASRHPCKLPQSPLHDPRKPCRPPKQNN